MDDTPDFQKKKKDVLDSMRNDSPAHSVKEMEERLDELEIARNEVLNNMKNDSSAMKEAAKAAMNVMLFNGVVDAMYYPYDTNIFLKPLCPSPATVKLVGETAGARAENITDDEINMSIAVGVAMGLNKMEKREDELCWGAPSPGENASDIFILKKAIINITEALNTQFNIDESKLTDAKVVAKKDAALDSIPGRDQFNKSGGGGRKSKKSKKPKRSRRGKKQIKKTKKYKKRSNKKRSNKK